MPRARKPSPAAFKTRTLKLPKPEPPEFDCAVCGALGKHRCPGGRYYAAFCGRAVVREAVPGERVPGANECPAGCSDEECVRRVDDRLARFPPPTRRARK
jgi:hypothetical protein